MSSWLKDQKLFSILSMKLVSTSISKYFLHGQHGIQIEKPIHTVIKTSIKILYARKKVKIIKNDPKIFNSVPVSGSTRFFGIMQSSTIPPKKIRIITKYPTIARFLSINFY
jgi:hypothetical protein